MLSLSPCGRRGLFLCLRALPPASLPSRCMAGHAKWQNIQYIKRDNDLRRSKLHVKYSNLVQVAIKENGNQTDPKLNHQLAKVIAEAMSQDVRKATLEAAIKQTTAKTALDKEFLAEVRGPGQCAILVEALAPNRGTLDSKLNQVLRKKHGYQELGTKNMFVRRGVVRVSPTEESTLDKDRAEELAIECDAEDVEEFETSEGNFFEFYCHHAHLMRVRGALAKELGELGRVEAAEVRYDPQVTVRLGRKAGEAARALIEEIHDKVPQTLAVHHNIEFAKSAGQEAE